MTELPLALQILLVALVIVAAGYDLKTRRIPNWVTLAGFALGFILQPALRKMAGFRDAFLGAALAFGIYFLLFALRAMGAGDVKLMTAAGAIAGPSNWLVIFLIAAITGGILAVALIVSRGTLLQTLSGVRSVLKHLSRGRAPFAMDPVLDFRHPKAITLPHAVPIAIGCMAYLWLAAGHL